MKDWVADEEELGKLLEKKEVISAEFRAGQNRLAVWSKKELRKLREESRQQNHLVCNHLWNFQEAYKMVQRRCQEGYWNAGKPGQILRSCGLTISMFPANMRLPWRRFWAINCNMFVVRNQEDGVRAIDYLKNYQLGRGSFVPVEFGRGPLYRKLISAEHFPGTRNHWPAESKRVTGKNSKQIADCLLGMFC